MGATKEIARSPLNDFQIKINFYDIEVYLASLVLKAYLMQKVLLLQIEITQLYILLCIQSFFVLSQCLFDGLAIRFYDHIVSF